MMIQCFHDKHLQPSKETQLRKRGTYCRAFSILNATTDTAHAPREACTKAKAFDFGCMQLNLRCQRTDSCITTERMHLKPQAANRQLYRCVSSSIWVRLNQRCQRTDSCIATFQAACSKLGVACARIHDEQVSRRA